MLFLATSAAIASVEIVPVIVASTCKINWGKTSIGKWLLKSDTNWRRGELCMISYMVFTILLALKLIKSKLTLPAKTILSFIVLYSNYFFAVPVISVTNLMLRPYCKNGPMNLDKSKYFPYSSVLEQNLNFKSIQSEITTFMNTRSVPCLVESRPDILIDTPTDDRCWRFVAIKKLNRLNELHRESFPMLYRLLDRDEISSAVISSLDPQTEIPPHRGYSQAFIRYHLAIEAPTDNPAYIVCGGERYQWKEGEGVCFDDMFTHYVKNPSKKRRTVLYLDIKRVNCPLKSVIDLQNHIFETNSFLKAILRDQHVPRKSET